MGETVVQHHRHTRYCIVTNLTVYVTVLFQNTLLTTNPPQNPKQHLALTAVLPQILWKPEILVRTTPCLDSEFVNDLVLCAWHSSSILKLEFELMIFTSYYMYIA